MQTFLPLPSFELSVRALDYRRLGKQRVEARQILDIITGLRPTSRWRNHPAVRMWRGFEAALEAYLRACILEWVGRGYNNTMVIPDASSYVLPPWFGDPTFHASHRSNLIRKLPEHYLTLGWTEPPDLPYVWPA